jgi:hypothetical protein
MGECFLAMGAWIKIIIPLIIVLALHTFYESYSSYKKGVFKEYRKMAPYIYHYRGKESSYLKF